jgi:hypothetical protein
MQPQVISRDEVVAAPLEIPLGASDAFEPLSAFAHFDGTAAAGAFLPCITYYSQDGKILARAFPSSSVAAGASADVSWFPGLSATVFPLPTTGIFYGVANTGQTLEVKTTGVSGSGAALLILATNDDVQVEADSGDAYVVANNGNVNLQAFGTKAGVDARLDIQTQGAISIQSGIGVPPGNGITINADADLTLRCNGTNKVLVTGGDFQVAFGHKIGFYGHATVAQAAHPVTLADVITLLTNLGLCA